MGCLTRGEQGIKWWWEEIGCLTAWSDPGGGCAGPWRDWGAVGRWHGLGALLGVVQDLLFMSVAFEDALA